MDRRFLTSAVAIHGGACLIAFLAVGSGVPVMDGLFINGVEAEAVASGVKASGLSQGVQRIFQPAALSISIAPANSMELAPAVNMGRGLGQGMNQRRAHSRR